MKKILLMNISGLIIFLAALFPVQAQNVTSKTGVDLISEHILDDNESLHEHLTRLVPFGFSGAVLISDNGEPVLKKGYGFAEWNTRLPNTSATVFDIGSLSKQFTAAVMALSEQGLLAPDDLIVEFLPDVPDDKKSITIHHLLTHTSGLPPFHSFGSDGIHGDFQKMNREEAERIILDRPLDFPPGEGWTYSNSGYTLLAAIVERVAGQSFENVLKNILFEPSGLKHTGFYFQTLWENASVAHGYVDSDDHNTPLEWTESKDLWGLIGNGGILSTLDDLEHWNHALLNGDIFSDDTLRLLFTPHVQVREGLYYGYGWYVEKNDTGDRVIRHGGANDFGFASRWQNYEDRDLLFVVLINRQPPGLDVSFAADAILNIVEDAILKNNFTLPPEALATNASFDFERYTGRYRLDDGSEFVVRPTPGGLTVEPSGTKAVRALAFPSVSEKELEYIKRVDHQSSEVLKGIAENDFQSFANFLEDSSAIGFYQNFISDWWNDFIRQGGDKQGVTVMGTVPMWWSPGDERLATLIRAHREGHTDFFRLHWFNGKIVGLGGGAIQEPVTTIFTPSNADAGDFIGYHLGIRLPVYLSFEMNPAEQIISFKLQKKLETLTARKLKE